MKQPPDLMAQPPAFETGDARNPVWRFDGERWVRVDDCLVEEVPVSLEWNGRHHVTMLVTPTDLEAYGIGFSLTEGIVAQAGEIEQLDVVPTQQGVGILMQVPEHRLVHALARRREVPGRHNCALCGLADLQQAVALPRHIESDACFEPAAVQRAMAALQAHQPLNTRTGAAHAAAFAAPDGTLLHVLEDAGRHNAMDKLVGRLAQVGQDPAAGFAVVTSRAGLDLVHKALAAGFPMLCAVSAATALGQRAAEAGGLTLVAFARGAGFGVLAHGWRLGSPAQPS